MKRTDFHFFIIKQEPIKYPKEELEYDFQILNKGKHYCSKSFLQKKISQPILPLHFENNEKQVQNKFKTVRFHLDLLNHKQSIILNLMNCQVTLCKYCNCIINNINIG